MSRGKTEEARKSIVYYHGITESAAQPLLAAMENTGGKGEKPVGFFQIFTDKKWLCGFLVGVGIMSGTILCGVAAVNAFAFEILMNVGLNALEASLGNMVICVMAVAVNRNWIGHSYSFLLSFHKDFGVAKENS
ncbi:unnamed protein product [Strongylus vulgaris]|uniref:Uncharacterized protein n=1 Tax=Strongylus vulgaris TaxID=40348 RepID=A0A3P7JBP0_STRVU|nr:unnamed protein product [Strongylus vulgaris]